MKKYFTTIQKYAIQIMSEILVLKNVYGVRLT